MKKKIVVIGSSNIDLIMQVDRLPKPGETITGGTYQQVFGGKGANQAIAAVRAGAEVVFISCLGDDSFADQMLPAFGKEGLITEFCVQKNNIPTGIAMIRIDKKGENDISVAPGANHILSPAHIKAAESLINEAEWIVLQCEMNPETFAFAIDYASSLGKKILLNLAPASPISDERLAKLQVLIVNETEASYLLGYPVKHLVEAQKAAQELRKKVKGVIITLGTKGSYISTTDFEGHVPSFVVEAVDTTAAGDVYCGSLATALCEDFSMAEAVRFASAAAAIAVTRLGAQTSVPYRKEIDQFLAKY